jgi:hypothetical protein
VILANRLKKSTAGGVPITSPAHPDRLLLYTMDNVSGTTLVDDSPNGNDALIGGGMAFGAGLIDNAMLPDGIDDYVDPPGAVQGIDLECMVGWFYVASAVSSGSPVKIIGSLVSDAGYLATGEVSGAISGETLSLGWVNNAVT